MEIQGVGMLTLIRGFCIEENKIDPVHSCER
jgi:hypothetical protein